MIKHDYFDNNATSLVGVVGGKSDSCKENTVLLGSPIEKNLNTSIEGRVLEELHELLQHIDKVSFPYSLDPATSTFMDVALHAAIRQRKKADKNSTIEHNIRYARMMETHPVVPVDFRHPNPQNFIRHMDYREYMEGATNALGHEWKAMKMFLSAYGIAFGPGTPWNYRPPCIKNRAKIRAIPHPDVVHQITHHTYKKRDSYHDNLIRYLILHNFLIGWRYPSEPHALKVSDVHIDEGFMIITEPKKGNPTRRVTMHHILTGRQKKSMENWLNIWRPRVEHSKSGDNFYLRPDGYPFPTKHSLSSWMNRHANKIIKAEIYPEYTPYHARHWFGISQLIQTKVKSGVYDYFKVNRMLGHDELKSTMDYVGEAEFYHELYGTNWISRTLKTPHTGCEESVKKPVGCLGTKRQNRYLSPKITPVEPLVASGGPSFPTGESVSILS